MNARTIVVTLGVAVLCTGLIGCSFSASLNTDGKAVLHGKDAILVKAKQPEPPPPPPPPPKPKPVLKAKVVGKKIEITEKVMFEYNKAAIKEESHGLLNDVATVMKNHVEITKVKIEGHTDSDGSAKYNKKLSSKRAKAVMDFLIATGIAEDRMESVGYGEDKPVASNDTGEGKEKNRRVEFNIVGRAEKKAEGKEGKAKECKSKKAEGKVSKADKADKTEKAEKAAKSDKK